MPVSPQKRQQNPARSGGVSVVGTSPSTARTPQKNSTAKDDSMTQLFAPLAMNDAWELEAEHALSLERLQQLTGFDDLTLVNSTELIVDSEKQSVSCLGEYMPNLQQLRLTKSNIPTLRDLGTRFSRLQVIWLNHCHVEDCSGLQHCHQLQELYLSFNKLTTISPLWGLLNLVVLDVEANRISKIDEVQVLKSLTELTDFNLAGNPICFEFGSHTAYRQAILEVAPQLKLLDDVEVVGSPTLGGGSGGEKKSDTKKLNPEPSSGGADGAALIEGGVDDVLGDGSVGLTKEQRQQLEARLYEDLGAELKALNECIKETHGLGMERIVEEQGRQLYSRGSASASGVRPSRQGPRAGATSSSSGGAGDSSGSRAPHRFHSDHPHPNSAPTLTSPEKQKLTQSARTSSGYEENHSSALTTSSSGTFSGSAIRNLRKKVPSATTGAGVASTARGVGGGFSVHKVNSVPNIPLAPGKTTTLKASPQPSGLLGSTPPAVDRHAEEVSSSGSFASSSHLGSPLGALQARARVSPGDGGDEELDLEAEDLSDLLMDDDEEGGLPTGAGDGAINSTGVAPEGGLSLFEQYKLKFGYTTSTSTTGSAPVQPSTTVTEATSTPSRTSGTTNRAELSVPDIVASVKNHKLAEVHRLEQTMLTEAMFGPSRSHAVAPTASVSGGSGATDRESLREKTNSGATSTGSKHRKGNGSESTSSSHRTAQPAGFESLSLNDFNAQDDVL